MLKDNGKEASGLKKNSTQKVVPRSEIKRWSENGIESVTGLDGKEAIVRLPNNN